MAKFMESVATVNSLIRTLLALVVVGGIGGASYLIYGVYSSGDKELEAVRTKLETQEKLLSEKNRELAEKQQEVAELQTTVQEQDIQIERLDTSMRLLKVNHRVARLRVIDQDFDSENGVLKSMIEFVELDEQGRPLDAAKRLEVEGDVIYVDSWVVKFDDQYVEQSDLDRSTSLVLFRRLFSNLQKPEDGFPLDTVGSRPKAYGRGDNPSDFEKKIWSDFWKIATDETRARELGIRAAHGEAPSVPLVKGMTYKIELRASDGLSISPEITPNSGTGASNGDRG